MPAPKVYTREEFLTALTAAEKKHGPWKDPGASSEPDGAIPPAAPGEVAALPPEGQVIRMADHLAKLVPIGKALGKAVVGGIKSKPDFARGYPEGDRNNELATRAGWCLGEHGGDMDEAAALAECLAWNKHNTPPLDEEEVRRTVASIASAEAEKRRKEASLFTIQLSADIAADVKQCDEGLLRTNEVYVRSGLYVSPITREVDSVGGGLTTQTRFFEHTVASLRLVLGEQVIFKKWNERTKKMVRTYPPKELLEPLQALAASNKSRCPEVEGIIATPTFRRDGSLLDKPGYDPATKLFLSLDPSFKLPLLFDAPTRDHALEALNLIDRLLDEVPFADGPEGVDRSVALSGILTATLRGSIDVAPTLAVKAHESGTGKGYYVHIASVTATGKKCAAIAAGKDEEELEKRLSALLLEGPSIICIDNVNRPLGGDFLEQASSETETTIRPLGRSKAIEIKMRTAMFATGNNLTMAGDMPRRSLMCVMDAKCENPETRQFKLNPLAAVAENRPLFIAAILTIARAWRLARERGERVPPYPPLNGYEQWTKAVREPLIWLGRADPVRSQMRIRNEDPARNELQEMRAFWPIKTGDNISASGLITEAVMGGAQELRELLQRIAGVGTTISPNRLGLWFRRNENRVVGDHRLVILKDAKKGHRYAFEPVK